MSENEPFHFDRESFVRQLHELKIEVQRFTKDINADKADLVGEALLNQLGKLRRMIIGCEEQNPDLRIELDEVMEEILSLPVNEDISSEKTVVH